MCDDWLEAPPVAALARQAGLSEKHFRRLFEQTYGATPGRFLAQVRLRRAKELLARGASVTEACVGVGFSSVGSFSSKFIRETGRSPRSFQRELRALGSVPARLVALFIPLCFQTLHLPVESLPVAGDGGRAGPRARL